MKIFNKKLIFLTYIIFQICLLSNESLGEIMNIQISLAVDKPETPIRYLEKLPIYPMANKIYFKVNIINIGLDDLVVEDPNTSQKFILWVLNENIGEPIAYEINPGSIDITGEITVPITSEIHILPKETKSILIDLHKYCTDNCLLPGKYEVYIEFMEIKSEPIKYGVEFHQDSVPKLLEIALNEKEDFWIRETSLLWLHKLPVKPDITLFNEDETEAHKKTRIVRNNENAKIFLESWLNEKTSEKISDFFEKNQLK